MTNIRILAQEKTEFERADEYRNNKYFKDALEIEKSIMFHTRQRFNAIGTWKAI